MPGLPTHLTQWFLVFRQALLSLTNLGDPDLTKANKLQERTSLAEVMLALHSILTRQILSGDLTNMPELHRIMLLLMEAADMVAPADQSEVYEAPPQDSELSNETFNMLKNRNPPFSMTSPRHVWIISDSFGCQGDKKAKTSFDQRMEDRFNDWVQGYGITRHYRIKAGATCSTFYHMLMDVIQECPECNNNPRLFKHMIIFVGMSNESASFYKDIGDPPRLSKQMRDNATQLRWLIDELPSVTWLGPGEEASWKIGDNWSDRADDMMTVLTKATHLVVVSGKFKFEGMNRRSKTDPQHFSGDYHNQEHMAIMFLHLIQYSYFVTELGKVATEWNQRTVNEMERESQSSSSTAGPATIAPDLPDTSEGVDARAVEERLKAEATKLGSITLFAEDDFPSMSYSEEVSLESDLSRCPCVSIPEVGDYIIIKGSNLDPNKPIQFCTEYTSLNSKGLLGSKLNALPPRKRFGPISEIKKILAHNVWGAAAKVYSSYASDTEVRVPICMDKRVICELTDPPTEEELKRAEARRTHSYPAHVPQAKASAQPTWAERVRGASQPKEEADPWDDVCNPSASSSKEEPKAQPKAESEPRRPTRSPKFSEGASEWQIVPALRGRESQIKQSAAEKAFIKSVCRVLRHDKDHDTGVRLHSLPSPSTTNAEPTSVSILLLT